MTSGARRAALAAAAALAAVTVARLPAAWESGNALNHVSGVWLALADDLAHGTLYRPLEADGVYGGTRYFPLVFALEAGLARVGVPLIPGAGHSVSSGGHSTFSGAVSGAGHQVSDGRYSALPAIGAGQVVSLGAGLLLVAGLAALLVATGARRPDALATGVLAFAGLAGQRALADARGDLLPVALSALALAAVARSGGDRERAGGTRASLPALLLILAFAAKPTALSAAAAAAMAFAARGARRAALALAALVAAGSAGMVLATDALSHGRFVSALRACAVAGVSSRTALAAPARLVGEAAREDPAGLALLALAAVALAAAAPALVRAARAGTADPRLVPALWLAAAWPAAVAVYASPGTGVNHLVEVEAASASLLAASGLVTARRARAGAKVACAVAAAGGLLGAAALWRADRSSSRLAEVRAVVALLPPGPVLSEDPLVPLVGGASPRVLDPFALRAAASSDPSFGAHLESALRAGAFPAIVLLVDADGPGAAGWYGRGNLGLPLVAAIRAGYRPAGAQGRYHVYVPRRVPDTGRPDAGRREPVPDTGRPREAGVVLRDGAR